MRGGWGGGLRAVHLGRRHGRVVRSAESNLVQAHGGESGVADGGQLADQLRGVAGAAEHVSQKLGRV